MKHVQIYIDGRWRYITAIVGNSLAYSVHQVNALPDTYLEICKAICPTHIFQVA